MDFFAQCGLIAWQVVCELVDLDHHHRRKAERDGQRQAHRAEHRDRPRQFHALQRLHEWRQDKAQKDGQRDRDQNFTREIQGGDDNGADQKV